MYILFAVIALITIAGGVHLLDSVAPKDLVGAVVDTAFTAGTAVSLWWKGSENRVPEYGMPAEVNKVTVFDPEGEVEFELSPKEFVHIGDKVCHLVRVDYTVGNYSYATIRKGATVSDAFSEIDKNRYCRARVRRGILNNIFLAASYYPTANATVNITDIMRKLQGPYCDFGENLTVTIADATIAEGMCSGGVPESAAWSVFGLKRSARLSDGDTPMSAVPDLLRGNATA